MNIDNLVILLNQKWTFKVLVFLILSFPSFQYFAQLQSIVLGLFKPEFKCVQNITIGIHEIDPSQCIIRNILTNITILCTKWKFSEEPVGRTMVSEFQLVCHRDFYNQLILILWYLPGLTSSFQGWLADKYGRKKLVILNLYLEICASISLVFAPDVIITILLRVFLGISTSGVFISYTWLSEMVDNKFRTFMGSFFWIFGSLPYFVCSLLVYFTGDWRLTQGYSTIPSCLYLFILLVPESPRWYYAVGNIKCSIRSLKTISRINGLSKSIKIESYIDQSKVINETEKEEDLSLLQSFKSTIFVKYLVVIAGLQWSLFMFYCGVHLNLTVLHKNIIIAMLIIGSMDPPTLIWSFLSLKYMSRPFSILLYCILGSGCLLMSILLDQNIRWQSITRLIFGMAGRVSLGNLLVIMFAYATELFPTSHRTFGIVSMQIMNCLGFILSIYINKFETFAFFLPILIYSILVCTISIVAWLTLPNTLNLPIPESVEDQKMLRLGCENEYLKYMNEKPSNIDLEIDYGNDNEKLPIISSSDH